MLGSFRSTYRMAAIKRKQNPGVNTHGIEGAQAVYRNLSVPILYEHVARRYEGVLSAGGALVVNTGRHTGRSANDKFIVEEPSSRDKVWWGKVNRPFPQAAFNSIHERMKAYMRGRELYVQDCLAGADPDYQVRIRVITELAWQSIFARHLFIQSKTAGSGERPPDFTVIALPNFPADPEEDGTNSETFILLDFSQRLVLIGGTSYAGEIKKSLFTLLNYLLPQKSVMSMHCSANVGRDGDVAIFFGLSGTGKTTLSADPSRHLIGDDEHGWSDNGVFNFEGGCYAKVIRLSPEAEPEIYKTTQSFGTVLENVIIDERGVLDLDDDSKTENTRAAYKLEQIANALPTKRAGHPSSVVFLTADAFGILPPIARLSREQAKFYFLSGFTAKLAGTEIGVTEPQPTFSACFGAPFLTQPPAVYAHMLGERLDRHGATVWLVNTGWAGGPFGEGERMPIAATRALLGAALSGELENAQFRIDDVFGFQVPIEVPDVVSRLLDPRSTWRDPQSYDRQA